MRLLSQQKNFGCFLRPARDIAQIVSGRMLKLRFSGRMWLDKCLTAAWETIYLLELSHILQFSLELPFGRVTEITMQT